jgi:ribosomal protein S18 acetylase RimI-like enzyme
MKTEIRNLNKKDIPTCIDIVLQTEAGLNAEEAKQLMERSLVEGIKPLNPDYYVLLLDGEIVGVSGLYYDYEDPFDIFWMDYFAVLPKFQRQGYGTEMLKNLETICEGKKARMLCVFTNNKKGALSFYKKNGFQVCGEIKNYYSDGSNRTWLYKNLK